MVNLDSVHDFQQFNVIFLKVRGEPDPNIRHTVTLSDGVTTDFEVRHYSLVYCL